MKDKVKVPMRSALLMFYIAVGIASFVGAVTYGLVKYTAARKKKSNE